MPASLSHSKRLLNYNSSVITLASRNSPARFCRVWSADRISTTRRQSRQARWWTDNTLAVLQQRAHFGRILSTRYTIIRVSSRLVSLRLVSSRLISARRDVLCLPIMLICIFWKRFLAGRYCCELARIYNSDYRANIALADVALNSANRTQGNLHFAEITLR